MIATLIGEGPSDRALVAPLRWLLRQSTPSETRVLWIEAFRLPGARSLVERVHAVRRLEAFDLLFVHRDADADDPAHRRAEIAQAAGAVLHVPVVPIRMTESWLLPHEAAIRVASGRPSGKEPLRLPPTSRIEGLPNPKETLREAVETAMNVRPGRRNRHDPKAAVARIPDLVEDWSPLRRLSAFQRLEADTRHALATLGLPLLPEET